MKKVKLDRRVRYTRMVIKETINLLEKTAPDYHRNLRC